MNVQLSKWWQTESCRLAFERAKQKRAEQIAAMRAKFDAKRAELKRDVETWEIVQ